MSDKNKVRKKIQDDPDFIYCPRLGNSMKIFLDKYPDGVENNKIAKLLMIDEDEVDEIFESALKKIREAMDIEI